MLAQGGGKMEWQRSKTRIRIKKKECMTQSVGWTWSFEGFQRILTGMRPCTNVDHLETEWLGKKKTQTLPVLECSRSEERSKVPTSPTTLWQALMCLAAFTCLDYSKVSVSKCHGCPRSSSPVETCGSTHLSATLSWLIAFTQLCAELNDALVPVFWQQKHEETQADDKHSDQAHCVEINITCVEVHHCKNHMPYQYKRD